MPVRRVESGILGLDEILYGGIRYRNVVLLSGGPGTGKTIFGQQYLFHGLEKGEAGVLVALEEHPVQIRINMSQFGWNVKPYEDRGLFAIVDAFTGGIGEAAKRERYAVKSVDNLSHFIEVVRGAIKDLGAERVVIDSVTTLYITKPAVAKGVMMTLKKVLAGLGYTSILISQVSVGERGFGDLGAEPQPTG